MMMAALLSSSKKSREGKLRHLESPLQELSHPLQMFCRSSSICTDLASGWMLSNVSTVSGMWHTFCSGASQSSPTAPAHFLAGWCKMFSYISCHVQVCSCYEGRPLPSPSGIVVRTCMLLLGVS